MLESLCENVENSGIAVLDGPHDLDQLGAMTGGLRANLIQINEPQAELDAHMTSLATFSLHHLTYGCAVTVTPRHYSDENYLVSLVMEGQVQFRYGAIDTTVRAGQIGLIAPYREFRSSMSANFNQLILVIRREEVEGVAAALIGHEREARFEPSFPEDVTPPSCRMLGLLHALILSKDDADVAASRRRFQLQQLTIESLLLEFPSLHQAILPDPAAGSRTAREAASYMIERMAEPLSITQVAHHVHVSPRALQLAFRKEYGEPPAAWLKHRRLAQARRLLQAYTPEHTTVSQVAESVGLNHFGNFSVSFRKQFGVSPSDVLRG